MAIRPEDLDEDAPVFAIAMAAELAGMHPQTLRQYDRLGLVVPQRPRGNVRRYSLRNVAELREIARLVADGLNLEGISRIIALREQVRALEKRVRALESELADERLRRPGGRVFAARAEGDVIPLAHGTRARRRTDLVVWSSRGRNRVEFDVEEHRP
ncbi:Putative heat shock protein HspR [Pseudoclavibacter triregionum]|nr:Putative heat shock protein HspR [Pseudoclavibacter triregionum]